MIVVVALKLFVYSIRVVLHFIGIYESCIYSVNDLLVSHYIPIFQGFCSRGQLRVAGVGEFRSVNENNKFVVSYLLGGLLLLLLFLGTIIGGLFCGGFCGCFFSWWGCFFLLLLTATGNKESNHILGSDETIIVDLEFAEDIIDLSLVEFVTEVHESMTEHLRLDFAVNLVGLEGTDDEVIGVVGATSHLLLEHLDHVVKVASTTNFSQHAVELTLVHQFTNVVEGSAEVRFAEGAVFVDIHKFEAFLVHINLLLGETAIITLAHDCCLDLTGLLKMN